nr:EOG090X04G9 [Ilyocryptus agilis]
MAQDEKNKEIGSKKKAPGKERDRTKNKEKPPSKVIIRRLPPTMTEEVFMEQIAPLPENDYFYFVQGKHHIGVPTFSRAYISFVNQEDIFTFQEKFDGYVFLDQKGNEFPAVVEFAPYQKIPRTRGDGGGKEDKCNTIENDPHYLDFLKKLESPEEVVLQSAESYLEQLEQKEREMKAKGEPKIKTPLVEFIVQRRLDREKYREEKKEERRKEMEKKKQRQAEKYNKAPGKKEQKKQDKGLPKGKNKDDDRPQNSIKVLKKAEKDSTEKQSDKPESAETAAKKPVKDSSRANKEKSKEKVPKDNNKSKPQRNSTEKKQTAEPVESPKVAAKAENDKAHSQQQSQPRKEAVAREEEPPASRDNSARESEPRKEDENETEKKLSEIDEKGRKIRNKDRPTIQIYRPGAKRLSSQKSTEEASSAATPPTSAGTKRDGNKSRTFSRSTAKE